MLDNDFDVALEMAYLTFWRRVFALLDADRVDEARELAEVAYYTELKRYAKHITERGYNEIAAIRMTLEARA